MADDTGGLLPLTVPLNVAEQALDLVAALLEPIDQAVLQARLRPLVVKVRSGAIDPDSMLLIRALALTATTFALTSPVDPRALVETTRAHHRAVADLARLDVEFPFDTGGDDGAG